MKTALALSAAIALTGCATSSFTYIPPSSPDTVTNSKSIEQSFEEVWDRLVKNLSSDFFVINNIDKSSRLINISFSSSRPTDYADCGKTSRAFKSVQGERAYNYLTAESANYPVANNMGEVFQVSRSTKLEGRANIYVAPEGRGTNVTINAKYVLTINTAITNVYGHRVNLEAESLDFSTKQSYSAPNKPTCKTNGTVEATILKFAG